MNEYIVPVISFLVFVILFILEKWLPLRTSTRKLLSRLVVNILVTITALLTARFVVRPATAMALEIGQSDIGLLTLVEFPFWVEAIFGFLLLDLAFYYWHALNHHVPLLWRFHNVHHADPDLDVSTAFRFHFGEVAMSAVFRVVQVVVIGVPATLFVVYEAAFIANTIFHHSNVRLPAKTERLINYLLVTPRMHGIHHSQQRNETNSNYSVVLSWWDWMHRSLTLSVPQSQLKIGVPAYQKPDDNRFLSLVCMPFRRQRSYWEAEPTLHDEPNVKNTLISDQRNIQDE